MSEESKNVLLLPTCRLRWRPVGSSNSPAAAVQERGEEKKYVLMQFWADVQGFGEWREVDFMEGFKT